MSKKIAVIIGVGAPAGLGASLCRRAAKEGHQVVVVGRTPEKIEAIAAEISAKGGSAVGLAVDVTDEASVVELFETVSGMDGELDVVVQNVGGGSLHETMTMTADFFEDVWRACCLAGFLVGREAGKRFSAQGRGSLLFTGATASLKSRAPFMAFASAKAGLRAVAAALARELGPQGVHVAHFIIDGLIDGERAKTVLPEVAEKLGEEGMLNPDEIAESYWQVHLQHRSAWTFELDLRPFKENF
ncbi:MAG: SDR family NAD(P)-dependent oxidoreductase [Hyphomicrobiaceae bacterium]